jgi:hypothetical protein
MKEQIKNIIESYCEGITFLEFRAEDLDKMADEILDLQLQQGGVSCQGDACKQERIDSNYRKYIELNKNVTGDN